MSTLQNELNKVCAFAGSGEITKKHIDETVIVSVEAKIFNLSRMITKGEADQAFETLSNLFKLREEPVMILGVLSKAYVDMYRVKAAKEKGISYTALADAFRQGVNRVVGVGGIGAGNRKFKMLGRSRSWGFPSIHVARCRKCLSPSVRWRRSPRRFPTMPG
jgi:hypothetical protein